MKNIWFTINVLSYLSIIRRMIRYISFLGMVISFLLCSHRLDGLVIKNGLKKDKKIINDIKIISVAEGFSTLAPSYFIDIPLDGVVLLPGDSINLRHLVGPSRYSEKKENMEVVVADGKDLNNLKMILKGKKFKGTIVKPKYCKS